MNQSCVDDANVPSTSNSQTLLPQFSHIPASRSGGSNVFRLLARREISPAAKHLSKRLWGDTSKETVDYFGPKSEVADSKHGLLSWVEAESLQHFSAKYCPLLPPPRSTIAAAFSSDGKTLASTHGDHTVKIIDCRTGNCLKVLSGHRRTPWVVRFHPLHSEILASGSLDHEVRLWDANTAECIGSRDFYRPIASIAFHAQGELLAVASGHKLYIWHYYKRGETPSPTIVLKTRRSLRAVHFHPHGAPFLLTAEVNDLDAPDSPMTLATSPGCLHYPPPAVLFANVRTGLLPSLEAKVPLMPFPCLFWPTFVKYCGRTSFLNNNNRATSSNHGQQRADTAASPQLRVDSNAENQHDSSVSLMEMSPMISSGSNPVTEDMTADILQSEMENSAPASAMDTIDEPQPLDLEDQRNSPTIADRSDDTNNIQPLILQDDGVASLLSNRHSRPGVEVASSHNPVNIPGSTDIQMLLRSIEVSQLHQLFPSADPPCWELPFLQGWLMGQTHAGLHSVPPHNDAPQENTAIWGNSPETSAFDQLNSCNTQASLAPSAMTPSLSQSRCTGRSGSRHRSRTRLMAPAGSGEGAASIGVANDESDPHSGVGRHAPEIAASLSSAAAAAELPCTVKLRIWLHNIQDPCAPLDVEKCRLTVPHAVLCSEMGAHFSPCGRFLAACVACMLPRMEADPGLPLHLHHDASGVATSPTRHPISAHQVVYELHIYSLEKETFGLVLASRAIRAAHCLTSIQFSPTSEHILLAYGRRHSSLLRSIVVDGETTVPIYTILEVYRVSDMELVRVLPSAEDEVNVACFHPLVGGGLVYGTKEGKLRILQYDGSYSTNCTGTNHLVEENMLEVQTYALEC